jgi:hypothetical protein
MTTWRDAPLDDAVFCQALYRDDGKLLGVIMRYYEDAAVPPDVRLRVFVAVFKEGVTRPPGTCRGRPPFRRHAASRLRSRGCRHSSAIAEDKPALASWVAFMRDPYEARCCGAAGAGRRGTGHQKVPAGGTRRRQKRNPHTSVDPLCRGGPPFAVKRGRLR